MKIELLFAKPKTWKPISWIIMLIERSRFSHCAIAYGDYDNKLVAHSTGHKVNLQTIEIFTDHYKIVETVIVDIKGKDFLRNIMKHMGKEYGYGTLIGIAIQRFLGLFGLKIKNPFGDGDDTFVCSELVIHMLQCASEEYDMLSAERDGPKKIYEVIKGEE